MSHLDRQSGEGLAAAARCRERRRASPFPPNPPCETAVIDAPHWPHWRVAAQTAKGRRWRVMPVSFFSFSAVSNSKMHCIPLVCRPAAAAADTIAIVLASPPAIIHSSSTLWCHHPDAPSHGRQGHRAGAICCQSGFPELPAHIRLAMRCQSFGGPCSTTLEPKAHLAVAERRRVMMWFLIPDDDTINAAQSYFPGIASSRASFYGALTHEDSACTRR